MNIYKIFVLVFSLGLFTSFTGCYTQLATTDSTSNPEYEGTYAQTESDNYFSEEDEVTDSSYFAETELENSDDETTIINNYYGYPYRSYYIDYYPSITFGIGFGWSWGWYYGAYYPYYYPYWSYYPGWCGYGWYYPSPYYYCYSPSYYYYNPYYSYGYPYQDYGYKTRNDYVSRLRNNSGGRNYGERTRDPLTSITGGTLDRSRDDITKGRDLTISRNDAVDRKLGLTDRDRDPKRELVSVDKNMRADVNISRDPKLTSSRNDLATDRNKTNIARDDKNLRLDRELSTKKYLGDSKRTNITKQLGIRDKNINSRTKDIDKRVGNSTRDIFDRTRSNGNIKTENRTNKPNTNYKPNDRTNSGRVKTNKTYSPPKRNDTNPPKSYTPPKRNNNPPKSYSPPKTNSNPPRSYNPPRSNTPPRSTSTPNRSGGNNSSGRRR